MALTREDVKRQMDANSAAWWHASPEEQVRLHDENVIYANMLGGGNANWNSNSGVWNIPAPVAVTPAPPIQQGPQQQPPQQLPPVYMPAPVPVYVPAPAPVPGSVQTPPAYQTLPATDLFPAIPMPLNLDEGNPVQKSDASRYMRYGVAAVIIMAVVSIFQG